MAPLLLEICLLVHQCQLPWMDLSFITMKRNYLSILDHRTESILYLCLGLGSFERKNLKFYALILDSKFSFPL